MSAQAVEFDVGLGMSHFVDNVNGLWYVEPFDHSMKMNSLSAELGVTENVWQQRNFGLDLRQAYVYLGEIHTHAMVPTVMSNTRQGAFVGPDFKGAATSNPCYGTCTNMSTFDGAGHDQGLSLTAQPYYIYKDYKFSLIGGAFAHLDQWSENVSNLIGSVSGSPYNLHVENHQGISVGETAGFAIRKGNMTIKYQFYRTPFHAATPSGQDAMPPAWHAIHNVSINWSF